MKYRFHADPGHAWLEVPVAELIELGIADQISPYSKLRGDTAFLEEDCDAPLFIKAAGLDADSLVEVYREHQPVRYYPAFRLNSLVQS